MLVLWLSLFCVSFGGTQALICIDVPLLLIILEVLSLPFFFLRIRNFFAKMLRIFQVAEVSLGSCVEL